MKLKVGRLAWVSKNPGLCYRYFSEDERYKIPCVGGEKNGINNISIKCGHFQNVNNNYIGIISILL